jgi:hypothetical protein
MDVRRIRKIWNDSCPNPYKLRFYRLSPVALSEAGPPAGLDCDGLEADISPAHGIKIAVTNQ